ncbi:M61 family metallopeptidase [Algoriphagus litoralis]|uniref:M61 family metallopeptidase n=1 Tax=Algoriphagus litoralis TaxID=2202829 RepID=UPI000DBABA6D|nr:M61 family peptidase [Algoriphagus litoralis]
MIRFTIRCKNPVSQFVQLELELNVKESGSVKLQLPAWRAGRYQLANFAQNLRNLSIFDPHTKPIDAVKSSKDCWEFHANEAGDYRICYEYYCGKMDAGSSWVNDEQVYLNLVNCCFEVSGRSHEEISVNLDLPQFPLQVSTLIPIANSIWKATDFQLLADSTVLASKSLTHWNYSVGKTQFTIWIKGEIHFDKDKFLESFMAFSEKLIQDFGEFPESEYQFIYQLLTYRHYHGVEHRRGTVITFGPDESLADPDQLEELLGVSCHELYHAWNVCRIRPKELLPYDFSKETYTKAGLLLEGVTTYMGDLYLLKSGVYDLPTYLKHLEKILARESVSFGWQNHTIAESSYDLWLDGYVAGIPDRKVNIYTRGALLSFCMDILLLKGGSSLSLVMKEMWLQYGQPFVGYTMEEFDQVVFEKFEDKTEIQEFFSAYIYGKKDLFPFLKTQFASLGIELEEIETENWLLHRFGIRINEENKIIQIHPESKAYSFLMKNDQILTFDFNMDSDYPELALRREEREIRYLPKEEKGIFFPDYRLSMVEENALTNKWKN